MTDGKNPPNDVPPAQAIVRYGDKHTFPDYRGYGMYDGKRIFTDMVNYAGKSNDVAGSGVALDYNLWRGGYSFIVFDLSLVNDIKSTSNEVLRLKSKMVNAYNHTAHIGVLREVKLRIKHEGGRLQFERR